MFGNSKKSSLYNFLIRKDPRFIDLHIFSSSNGRNNSAISGAAIAAANTITSEASANAESQKKKQHQNNSSKSQKSKIEMIEELKTNKFETESQEKKLNEVEKHIVQHKRCECLNKE